MSAPRRFLVGTLSPDEPLWEAELVGGALTVRAVPLRAQNVFSITMHPSLPLAYLVEFADSPLLHVLSLGDGPVVPLSSTPLEGIAGACRVRVDAEGTTLAVAGYFSSNVLVARLASDGLSLTESHTIALKGHGPDPDRQTVSHPHDVLFRGDELIAVDLGADRLHRLNLADGLARKPVLLPRGSGPRHAASGPDDTLVVSGELDSAVYLVGASETQSAAASTVDGGERNYPSTILYSERHTSVWVANRGANTIRRYGVEGSALVALEETPSGAQWPEHLAVVDDVMLVAHSRGNSLTVLPIDSDGRLGSPLASAAVPQAVWVEPVPTCSNRGTASISSRV